MTAMLTTEARGPARTADGVASWWEIVPNVRKIAVLRANAIGDYLVSEPAFAALRAAYPDAEITLFGREWHARFLSERPSAIDRVVVVPPAAGIGQPNDYREDPQELDRFFAEMRCEEFDLAIQLHGGGRYSNPFLRRLGARLTAGLRDIDAGPLDRWIRYVYFQSEVHRYLETVALVGARAIRWEPWVCVTPRDREAAGAVLREGDAPLVIIHPGASDPRRHWPAERFAVVADQLAAEGFQIALVGTKPEAALIQAVLHGMQAPATNLCDQLTLGALAALLQRAALVIANDSGPAHLAAAVGAKAVVIYWVGNLINAGPLSRRRVRPVISFRTQCLRCGRDCVTDPCTHSETFVGDVKVDRVIAEALDLLACDGAPRVLRSQPLTLNGS